MSKPTDPLPEAQAEGNQEKDAQAARIGVLETALREIRSRAQARTGHEDYARVFAQTLFNLAEAALVETTEGERDQTSSVEGIASEGQSSHEAGPTSRFRDRSRPQRVEEGRTDDGAGKPPSDDSRCRKCGNALTEIDVSLCARCSFAEPPADVRLRKIADEVGGSSMTGAVEVAQEIRAIADAVRGPDAKREAIEEKDSPGVLPPETDERSVILPRTAEQLRAERSIIDNEVAARKEATGKWLDEAERANAAEAQLASVTADNERLKAKNRELSSWMHKFQVPVHDIAPGACGCEICEARKAAEERADRLQTELDEERERSTGFHVERNQASTRASEERLEKATLIGLSRLNAAEAQEAKTRVSELEGQLERYEDQKQAIIKALGKDRERALMLSVAVGVLVAERDSLKRDRVLHGPQAVSGWRNRALEAEKRLSRLLSDEAVAALYESRNTGLFVDLSDDEKELWRKSLIVVHAVVTDGTGDTGTDAETDESAAPSAPHRESVSDDPGVRIDHCDFCDRRAKLARYRGQRYCIACVDLAENPPRDLEGLGPCAECEGTGYVRTDGGTDPDVEFAPRTMCSACHGSGAFTDAVSGAEQSDSGAKSSSACTCACAGDHDCPACQSASPTVSPDAATKIEPTLCGFLIDRRGRSCKRLAGHTGGHTVDGLPPVDELIDEPARSGNGIQVLTAEETVEWIGAWLEDEDDAADMYGFFKRRGVALCQVTAAPVPVVEADPLTGGYCKVCGGYHPDDVRHGLEAGTRPASDEGETT